MTSTPNILLIISDQQRTDTLGFLGRTPCRTPHLDRLAAEGVSFDCALTPCPLCGPARASLFTGLYPHQARGVVEPGCTGPLEPGMKDVSGADMLVNDYSLQEPPLLTDQLRARGYHTAYAGKWHLGNDVLGNWFDKAWGYDNQQYVDWCAESGLPDGWPLNDMRTRTVRTPHMSIPRTSVNPIAPEHTNDAWIADIAIRYLEERPKDRPFFVACGFNGPHPPFKIPEPYYSMYDPADVPEPPNFRPTDDEPEANRRSFYRTLWQDHGDTWDAWRESVAVYWGFCSLIDDQVGRLLACLETQDVLDKTLVIFCSDHGEMLGQHGLWHKMHAYEEALRVPLLMRAPWLGPGGIRHDGLASLLDVPSTICGALGLETPASYEGVDLSPVLRGAPLRCRKYLFSEHKPLGDFHGATDWRVVTDGRFKFTWNCDDKDELYDLTTDPCELHNLAGTPGGKPIEAGLREALQAWMRRTDDPFASDLTTSARQCGQPRQQSQQSQPPN